MKKQYDKSIILVVMLLFSLCFSAFYYHSYSDYSKDNCLVCVFINAISNAWILSSFFLLVFINIAYKIQEYDKLFLSLNVFKFKDPRAPPLYI